MLQVQALLRSGEEVALRHIEGPLAIKVKRAVSPEDGRVLFKYDQISSPMGNQIVQECRGLILDRLDNWNVVSWPFRKFFNHGEGHAAPIDFSTAFAQEKIDGSCCTVYYWKHVWHVQTLGMMDANGTVGFDGNVMFCSLFWKIFDKKYREFLFVEEAEDYALDSDCCYTFELATPLNRVVSRYDVERLPLIGVRNVKTLQEIHPGSAEFDWAERPAYYKLDSFEDCVRMASELPQLDEGYVVCDSQFNRVKVKNPAYVAISHLKESMTASIKGLVTIACKNEGEEFLTYFPEYRQTYEDIRAKLAAAKATGQAIFDELRHIESQKEFALALIAKKYPFQGMLFSMRAGKLKSFEEGFADWDPKKLAETLGVRSELTSCVD